jgi:peptidoglycan-associated lipoprotein
MVVALEQWPIPADQRGHTMTWKLLPALCAALLLLAACNNTPADQPQTITDPNALASAGVNGNPDATMNSGPLDAAAQLMAIGNTVHFATDSYSLDAEAQATLQKQAGWLQQNPQRAVTVEGHADERGTREYNLALGDRRAQAVVNYLTALGVDAARVKAVSYGKEKPVCPDATESCWSQNRRGVTTLDN